MKKKIILTEQNHSNLCFIPLTKEECDSLEKELNIFNLTSDDIKITKDQKLFEKYGIKYSQIIELGDTNVNPKWLNDHIEKHYLGKNPNLELTYTCKCFCNTRIVKETGLVAWKDKAINHNMILHNDPRSSWNCLMNILNNPTHGVVTNELLTL